MDDGQGASSSRWISANICRDTARGQLERNVAAVADDLGTDLDQLLAQVVSDHNSAALDSANVRMKLPRLYASAWS